MIPTQNNSCVILVIEPNRADQSKIESQINSLDLCVVYVIDAQEAKQYLEVNALVKLILCAETLPDCDGVELCQAMRNSVGDTIPIVLLSHNIDKKLVRKALMGGLTEVISHERLIEIQPYLQNVANLNVDPKNKTPHVLFVEDSETIAMITIHFLMENGYIVDTTTSAEEAIKLLNEQTYDIVITDILLEGNMTGMNLIRHIRNQQAPLNNLPILAISGLKKESQRIESLRLGATDFITKPIKYEELHVRLDNLIKTKRLFDRVFEQGKQLEKLAMTDPLTGLYNRHYLADIIPKRLMESERHQQALSIILLDLDKFKEINDQFGHLQGDQVLKDVGKILEQNCREEDFAVRFAVKNLF